MTTDATAASHAPNSVRRVTVAERLAKRAAEAAKRHRDAEDDVLAAALELAADDQSETAKYIREVAQQIAEHRAARTAAQQ